MLKRKDLLGLIDASASEITEILDLAQEYKNRIRAGEKKISRLEGKTVTVLFYENSTRTRTSFEEAAKVTAAIKEKFGDVLNPLQNGNCIDIVSVNMNKAKGIYKFIELLGAEYSDVITVGDNINDKDMIKEFRSYAMENAVPLIKELADYETSGITELIERELEINP